jgi:PiT family inorganic phosphate transporter
VAGNIVIAWVLTLPASAAVGAITYGVVALFGTDDAGPLVVAGLLLALLTAAFARRIASGRTLTAEG